MPASTAQCTLAGTSYSPFDSAFAGPVSQPADGIYFAVDPFGTPPYESPVLKTIRDIQIPGLAGIGTKTYNTFAGRTLTFEMLIADGSKAGVETRKGTLFSALTAAAAFTCQVPGGTSRSNCRLVPPGAIAGYEWMNIGTQIVLRCVITVKQYRE